MTKPTNFTVTVFGQLQPYNGTISKARVRIFYKGHNRNASYITEPVAEKLISTLAYTPIKGIYDEEEGDFTNHGKARKLGKAYGVVPNPTNFAWETHLDEDGELREYACADVLLWTSLYEEANKIVGKSQSMEICNTKGEWKFVDGRKSFVFEDASFLGLQVLGDAATPAFEGSKFFEKTEIDPVALYAQFQEMVYALDTLNKEGGQILMEKNYRLSNSELFETLWDSLNENFTEEKEWAIDYGILQVEEDSVLVKNLQDETVSLIQYSMNEEGVLELGEKKQVSLITLEMTEYEAFKDLTKNREITCSELKEKVSEFEKIQMENSEKLTKIEELETNYSTISSELESAKASIEEKATLYAEMENELNALKEFKLGIEKLEKERVLGKYNDLLSEEVIETYRANLSNYGVKELEKELSYEYINSNPNVFTKEEPQSFLPKGNGLTGMTELEAILTQYPKK